MIKSLLLGAAATVAVAIGSAQAQVRVESVRFTSGGETLVGDLYLPDGVSAERPGPAVIVSGAWMTIKDQMPATYARAMAERGYVALAFDFRNWGESGGDRRNFESPAAKIEDLKAAALWLSERDEVDPARVGALAVCVSSSYLAQAATDSEVIRAVAFVAPWLHDAAALEEAYGGPDAVAERRAAAAQANALYESRGEQTLVPVASRTDRSALLFDVPYYTETERGLIPAWSNQADVGFWSDWMDYDAIARAPGLTKPAVLIHSEAAAIPGGAHRFYAALTGPKRELWLDDVTQFDFYDRPEPVKAAADAAAAHFAEHLQ